MANLGEEITQEELRPGLIMIKRRTLKEDGRYLIYFEFKRDSCVTALPGQSEPAAEQRRDSRSSCA